MFLEHNHFADKYQMKTRTQIQIKGIVQGVGFRPFVFAPTDTYFQRV